MATVLVIDDDAALRRLICYFVAELGHECAPASSLAEAMSWATANERPPELVLLDMVLLDGSGYALRRALVGLPGWGEVPIVAVTGYGVEHDGSVRTPPGFRSAIGKPFTGEALRGLLRVHLAG